MITDPLFYAAAIPAVMLWGLSKGGFTSLSMLSLPIMALVISPLRAASIVLPILITQDFVSVWAYRRTWDKRNLTILIPSACIGIGLGYFFAAFVSEATLSLSLGLVSVVFAIRRLILELRSVPPAPTRSRVAPGIFWGTVAGFTSLIANAGGPPFQVYVMPQRLPRDSFVGTGVIFFAVVNWIKVPPFIALGLFKRGDLLTAAVLLPLAIVSTWAGVKLVRRVPAERFYRLIYGLLIVVGTKLIWSGIEGMT